MQLTKFVVTTSLLSAVLVLSTACGPRGPGGPGSARRGPPPFSGLDLNADGVVTLEEFREHKIPHGEHAEVFSRIDANADGQMTEEEFTSHEPPPPPR